MCYTDVDSQAFELGDFGSKEHWRLLMLDRLARPYLPVLTYLLIGAISFVSWNPLPARAGFDAHGGPVKGIAVSRDSKRALTASFDYSIILWNLLDQSVRAELHGHEAAVNAVAFMPDGKRALSASDDGTVGVWDLLKGEPVARLQGHGGKVVAIAVSPDGRTAASASWDRTVRLWDLETMEFIRIFKGADNLNAVAFSPDGERLLAGASDGSLQLWRVADGIQVMVINGHDFAVTGLDQSPDGQVVATSSVDETVQLWDVATGQGLDSPFMVTRDRSSPLLCPLMAPWSLPAVSMARCASGSAATAID